MIRRWLMAAAVAAIVAGSANAQDIEDVADGFDIQTFQPPTDPFGYGMINGARSLDQWQFHVAAYTNYARDPLRFSDDIATGDRDVIKSMTTLDLAAGVGIFKIGNHGGVQAGVNVPIYLDIDGTDPVDREGVKDYGFGDVRPEVKVTVLDREDDLIGIAGRVFLKIPTGEEEEFTSYDKTWSGGGTLIVEKKMGIVRLGVEAGWQYIENEIRIGGLFTVDDKLLWGAAIAVEPIEHVGIFAEVHGEGRAEKLWDQSEESPIEAGGGVRYTGFLFAVLGAYGGLTDGVGAADWRVAGAVGITF
jgi:hypothetical protein